MFIPRLSSFLLLFITFNSYSASPDLYKVSGKIVDKNTKEVIEFATIALFQTSDSTVVAASTSDSKGEFSIQIKNSGHYFIKIDFVSYRSRRIKDINFSSDKPKYDLGSIGIEQNTRSLSEVEIRDEKSQVQIGLDKKVYNVEKDLTSTGGTASQVLQNVPSVTTDMDGTISLRGSSNVRILVNGKPSNITGSSKADILEQIPASSIESIEVITNPSAKYDSESMAGIINIVLKKQRQNGVNGLFTATAGTGDKYTGSANVNMGLKKLNVYGSYDSRYNHSTGYFNLDKLVRVNSENQYLQQRQNSKYNNENNSGRIGADYTFNDKNTLSISSLYRKGNQLTNTSIDYTSLNQNQDFTKIFKRFSDSREMSDGFDNSLNYRKTFAKKNELFTADVLFNTSNENTAGNNTENYFYNQTYNDSGNPLLQNTHNVELQKNLILQADYSYPFDNGSKLDVGYKTSNRAIDVDFNVENYDYNQSAYLNNTLVSNHFKFNELINAGYLMYGGEVKKFGYQLGTRVEQTNIKSELINTHQSYPVNYIDFFPTAHISREVSEGNRLQFGYSRRLNRPSFHLLNPFTDYSDPYNIRAGNPALKPEYIHSLELSDVLYHKQSTFSGTFYYRSINNVIRRVINVQDRLTSSVIFENLGRGDFYGLEAVFSTTILKFWKFNLSGNFYTNTVNSIQFGKSVSSSLNGRSSSNFTLPGGTELQITGNYRSPAATPQGKILAMYFIDLGLKKDIIKNRLFANLRVSDVFNTQRFRIQTQGETFDITGEFKRESRILTFGLTYKLNNYKVKERKKPQGDSGTDNMGDY